MKKTFEGVGLRKKTQDNQDSIMMLQEDKRGTKKSLGRSDDDKKSSRPPLKKDHQMNNKL